jgi:hypothetical protein
MTCSRFSSRDHRQFLPHPAGRLARQHRRPRAGHGRGDKGGQPSGVTWHGPDGCAGHWHRQGDIAGYHQLRREFSRTEGAARGTRGPLGPGGRDQRVFVAGSMVLELGQRAWDPGEGDGL